MSKDEANLRRVEGTREMHSISVHGRETDNLWSRLCVRLVRFPDALSTGDVYPLQRGSSLDSLSPLLLPHDSHFLLLSVSLSLSFSLVPFLRCVVSLVPPFSLFSSGAGARYAIPKIYGRFRNIFGRSHACCYIFTGWQFRLLSLIASASVFSLDENYSG